MSMFVLPCRAARWTFNPVYELKATMGTLCNDLKDRAQYVDLAFADGVAHRSHIPSRLPDNIYGSRHNAWSGKPIPRRSLPRIKRLPSRSSTKT